MPIKYYVPIHVDWALKRAIVRIEKNDLLVEGGRVRIFWSSKYVDFDKIILARKTFGNSMVKPTVKNGLKVEVEESVEKSDQLELKTQTVFNFRILNTTQIRVLDSPEPERER